MGVLEDAIREHLELKRQHGATEDELERQQTEALGPVRRDVTPDDSVPAEEPVELQDEDAVAAAPASGDGHGLVDEHPPEELLDDAGGHEPPAAGHSPLGVEPPAAELPPVQAEGVAPEPAAAPESGHPPMGADGDEAQPVQDDELLPVEDEPADDDAAIDDEADVLQDTPDFLQDAPEHDRLWFEQKPPRDFDFD